MLSLALFCVWEGHNFFFFFQLPVRSKGRIYPHIRAPYTYKHARTHVQDDAGLLLLLLEEYY